MKGLFMRYLYVKFGSKDIAQVKVFSLKCDAVVMTIALRRVVLAR
jgi:hypothetical protein